MAMIFAGIYLVTRNARFGVNKFQLLLTADNESSAPTKEKGKRGRRIG
jgi:hypothetical protein